MQTITKKILFVGLNLILMVLIFCGARGYALQERQTDAYGGEIFAPLFVPIFYAFRATRKDVKETLAESED